MSTGPWYQDGLCFECTLCGNCCTGAPGVVWVDDDDIRLIAEHTGRGEGEIRVMHTRPYGGRISLQEFANGDCTFFDPASRRCTIYSVRPRQCRSWPFWASNVSSPAAWEQVKVDCPGAGRGERVSGDTIESMVSDDDV